MVLRDAFRSLDLGGSEKDALDRLQAAGVSLAISAGWFIATSTLPAKVGPVWR